MEPNKKIVVIDDEPSVQEVVRGYLEKDGYLVYVAGNGRDGLALAERAKPGLIVLDLMLPDVSGEEICREIRSRSDVPILMLTAKASEDERVGGLALGADDYLTKPFSPRELVARVRAVLRRVDGAGDRATDALIRTGELTLDVPRMRTELAGRTIDLTPTEFALLAALARQPGRVFTRSQLLDAVHGIAFESYERAIDTHVKNIRRKLDPDPRRPLLVQTVYGVGYRLADERP